MAEVIYSHIAYICDRMACPKCSYPQCQHTCDVRHAVNFCRIDALDEGPGCFMEKITGDGQIKEE